MIVLGQCFTICIFIISLQWCEVVINYCKHCLSTIFCHYKCAAEILSGVSEVIDILDINLLIMILYICINKYI